MRIELTTFALQVRRSNQLSYIGKKIKMRRPGLEPGSIGWKPTMITPTLTTLSRQPDSNQ